MSNYSYDIVGYEYQADLYCGVCTMNKLGGADPDRELDSAATDEAELDQLAEDVFVVDRHDEATYDSDFFPKVVFRDQVEAEDRCGWCGMRLS